MKKALIVTAFIIIFALGLFSILMAMRRPWIEPLPGVRLTPTRPILLEKDVKPDSACDLLLRAGVAAKTVNAVLHWNSWEEPKAIPWSLEQATNTLVILEQASESLELARRAAAAPDPQIITVMCVTQSLPHVDQAWRIPRFFVMSGKVRAIQGDYAGAIDELKSAIRFGEILTRGGAVSHHMVGIDCCSIACKAMRQIGLNYPVHEKLLRETSSFLQETDNNLEPWVESIRHAALAGQSYAEIFFTDPSILWLEKLTGGPARPRPVPPTAKALQTIAPFVGSKPAAIKRDLNACYSHLVSMAEKPYDYAAYESFEDQLGQLIYDRLSDRASLRKLLASRDPVGRMLASLYLSAHGSGHSRHIRNIADLRATRIVFAIVMFKRVEGRLPRKLEELVPEYLDKVPDDPFGGKPMKYRVDSETSWAVYSVGANQKDDGGIDETNYISGKPDIVFGPQEKP